MTQQLAVQEQGLTQWPEPVPRAVDAPVQTDEIVLYGDFTCPWSYLAARRADRLAAQGVTVDWRAVQGRRMIPRRDSDPQSSVRALRRELDLVEGQLLPGEDLPYALAGFVPDTEVAVSAYAEAYVAGVAAEARPMLFNAFWMGAVDLSDVQLVRTLLRDAVQSGSSPSDVVRDWGYVVDNTGAPVSTSAWRCVRGWAADRAATGTQALPVLLVGEAPLFGADAVAWLGDELVRRGLQDNPNPPTITPPAPRPEHDLASLSWVSQHGNRWLRSYQRAHRVQ